jgi:hypothetical protein
LWQLLRRPVLEDWGCLSRAGAVPVLATVGAMGNAESTEIVDEDGAIQSEPESGSVLLKLRKIRDRIGDHVSEIGEELVEGYATISSPAFCTEARNAADCCGPGEPAYKGSANRLAKDYFLADVSRLHPPDLRVRS